MATPSVDTGKLLTMRYVQGLTYDQIGQLTGVPEQTVYSRLQRFTALLEMTEGAELFQQRESNLLAGIRARLLAHACKDEVIEKMSGYQAIGSYGLLFDKQRILDGKSTANISILSKLVDTTQESADQAIRKSNAFPQTRIDQESDT